MVQSQIGEVLTRVSVLRPPHPTSTHPGCSQKPSAKDWVLLLTVPEEPGLASRSPACGCWGPQSSLEGAEAGWAGLL